MKVVGDILVELKFVFIFLHNDLFNPVNNYALKLNYMKLHNCGILSPLTFNIVG